MAIVRWDPFREISSMQERINRLFGEMYSRRSEDDLMSRGEWLPAVDIHETDKGELVLRAELPGMKREEIDLRVENNVLTLRGERKRESEVRDDQYHRIERAYGTFARSFALPSTIDTEKVRAEYKDGVLTVTMPTREEAKPKQIPVHVS